VKVAGNAAGVDQGEEILARTAFSRASLGSTVRCHTTGGGHAFAGKTLFPAPDWLTRTGTLQIREALCDSLDASMQQNSGTDCAIPISGRHSRKEKGR
jgi:hypothetical protein